MVEQPERLEAQLTRPDGQRPPIAARLAPAPSPVYSPVQPCGTISPTSTRRLRSSRPCPEDSPTAGFPSPATVGVPLSSIEGMRQARPTEMEDRMPEMKLGILLWSQAADWPELLDGARRVDDSAMTSCGRGITCTPSSATRTSPSSRATEPRGVGDGDRARPPGPARRREHVPQSRPRCQADRDARPHLERPRDHGSRRRLVRSRARGARHRLRVGLRPAA